MSIIMEKQSILTSERTWPIYRLTGGKKCRGRNTMKLYITAFSPVAGDTQYEAKQLQRTSN